MEIVKTVAVLVSWAVQMTDYTAPEKPPEVEFKPHGFFVEQSCNNRECDVLGWYNDRNIIYLDERIRGRDSVFIRSLIFHEVVHYLQHKSGRYDSESCDDQVAREVEAYSLQRTYVARVHGEAAFMRPHPHGCRPDQE